MTNGPKLPAKLLGSISAIALCASAVALAEDLGEDGFILVIDGEQLNGDPSFDEAAYETSNPAEYFHPDKPEIALDLAEVDVTFDGLDAEPALDLVVVNDPSGIYAQSYSNYPAFIARGEVVAIDSNDDNREIASAPLAPNQAALLRLPQGEGIRYIYKVYDTSNRRDMTEARAAGRDAGYDISSGNNSLAEQTIPVFGGAVRVQVQDGRDGATLATLGERFNVPPSGELVVERILPPGQYDVGVDYSGGRAVNVTRVINIPDQDWFYIGIADATIGQYLEAPDDHDKGEVFTQGRAAFFLRGRIRGDYLITAQADTGEGEFSEVFRGFDGQNADDILARIDPDEYYPVYGDQSVIEDWAPSSGKFYIRVERGENYAMWGNFRAQINGAELVRNERALYGAAAEYHGGPQNSRGDYALKLTAHAALPERMQAADEFLGTGGSVYFLSQQDITYGSSNLFIEYRDPNTGRVISRENLAEGEDYEVNAMQGVITLNRPLSSQGPKNSQAYLVDEYEYTPSAGDLDSFSYAGRIETSPNDVLTLGASYVEEAESDETRRITGVDATIHIGKNSSLRAEYAQSEGRGLPRAFSEDGGFSFTQIADEDDAEKAGAAYLAEAEVDLADVSPDWKGDASAYIQMREDGFRTGSGLQSGDETLYGARIEVPIIDEDNHDLVAYADHLENSNGREFDKAGLRTPYQLDARSILTPSLDYARAADPAGVNGEETIVGMRLDHNVNEALSVFGYARGTAARSGDFEEFVRSGAGVSYQIDEHWRVQAAVDNGTGGWGGELRADYDDGHGNVSYFGYEMDQSRPLGELPDADDGNGRFLAGTRQQINDELMVYGETRYDLWGRQQSLANAFGADYKINENWSVGGAVEFGNLRERGKPTLKRQAVSLGFDYSDGEDAAGSLRLEYRNDQGEADGSAFDQTSWLLRSQLRRVVNEAHTYFGEASVLYAEDSPIVDQSGTYAKFQLGYAYRPIDNDRLNVLFKYQYLNDEIDQELNGSISRNYDYYHAIVTDFRYDLDGYWDVGMKLAYRDAGGYDASKKLIHNRALMIAPSVRYHISHEWDVYGSLRHLSLYDAELTDWSGTLAVYRKFSKNFRLGIGYNLGEFTDDITDMDQENSSVFLNAIAEF